MVHRLTVDVTHLLKTLLNENKGMWLQFQTARKGHGEEFQKEVPKIRLVSPFLSTQVNGLVFKDAEHPLSYLYLKF